MADTGTVYCEKCGFYGPREEHEASCPYLPVRFGEPNTAR